VRVTNEPPVHSSADPEQVLSTLVEYVRTFGGGRGEDVTLIQQSQCSCGGTLFWMQCSEEEGVANRTCVACKRAYYIGDSEEHWAAADVGDATCPCKAKVFNIAVGYCCNEAETVVTWMVVGGGCAACGEAGVYADWCIDYEPSAHLLELA
jgi:hypothetical protein